MKLLFTSILPLVGMFYVFKLLPVMPAVLVALALFAYFLFFNMTGFMMLYGAMIYNKTPQKGLGIMLKALNMKLLKHMQRPTLTIVLYL